MSVKGWVASGRFPFAAVMVIGYELAVPAAGVPESTPVVELRVTPVGRAPVSLNVGGGLPVAVTVKVPAVPTVNVVALAEVMVGGTGTVVTESVKLWVAFGRTPLAAVMVIGYEGLDPMIGVPESTPVVELRVTPPGRAPVSE